MVESTSCVFCGSKEFYILYSRMDLRYSLDENVYSMNRCRNCSGMYLSPRVDEDEIGKYYPNDYYFEELTRGEIMKRELVKNVRKYNYLRDIKPGRLLDIGCRDGSFIKFVELFDWQAEGYDYDVEISNRFNCKIIYGEFEQLKGNFYDVISLWAVLEHLYHPNKYLEQIYEMLNPGGYLIIQVPKYNSFTGKVLLHEDVPRHVTAYTPTWLKSYIENFGFRQIRINTRCNVFWGSSNGFVVYFFKRLQGFNKDQALREIYGNAVNKTNSRLWKVDLFFSKYLDKILRRLDYWGQMTAIYTKGA